MKSMDSNRMLVLSLGTGAAKQEMKYSAAKASKWGLINWIFDNGSTPLIDIYFDSNSDIADFHLSAIFQAQNSKENYLRIQVIISFIYIFLSVVFTTCVKFTCKLVIIFLIIIWLAVISTTR